MFNLLFTPKYFGLIIPEKNTTAYLNYLEKRLRLSLQSDSHAESNVDETLKELAKELVWASENNEVIFQYFFINNLDKVLYQLLALKNCTISQSLLRFFNILLESVDILKLTRFDIYVILATPFDMSFDETLQYYITALRLLSQRLTTENIDFFISANKNNKTDFCWLYSLAVAYFEHPEPFVQIGIKTVVLNLFKLRIPQLQSFLLHDKNFISYFIRVIIDCFSKLISKSPDVDMDLEHFTGLLEYMEELFNLDIEELNSYLANAIVDSILVQVIYPAFYKGLQAQCAALFFCTRFIKTISHVYLIDYVLDMVLGDFTGTVTLNTPKPSIGDQEDNISDTKSTISCIRELIYTFLEPQEDGRRICMTLSLLYTIITTFESNPSRLEQFNLCPYRFQKSKKLIGSLMETLPASTEFKTDEKLFTALIRLLISDYSTKYSLLTLELIAYLFVSLFSRDTIGKECRLCVVELHTALVDIWNNRMLNCLEMDSQNTIDIVKYETTDAAMIDLSICCNDMYQSTPKYSEQGTIRFILLDSVVKMWLLVRQILIHLEVFPHCKIPLTTTPNMLDTSLNLSGNIHLLPCLIQMSNSNIVEPPKQCYFVFNDFFIVFTEPDRFRLGRSTIVFQNLIEHLEVNPSSLFGTVDIYNKTLSFKTNRDGKSKIGLEGFDIVEEHKSNWSCRVICSTEEALQRIISHIRQRKLDILNDKRRQLIEFLSSK